MIVYGDRERELRADDAFAGLEQTLQDARQQVAPLLLREALATLLIDVGALAQALEDADFQRRGHDELTALSNVCAEACAHAGRAFVACHRGRTIDWAALIWAIDTLRQHASPSSTLRLRDPEGFAFYALYPELYLEAAARIQAATVQVIGIRSIGSGLAGLVTAALESELPARTVRPVGHPFARELRLGPQLTAALLREASERTYAIVDEGPGLSGSSFDAVMQFLRAHGVAREQVVLLPSHDGEPGGQADDARRDRYRKTNRSVVPFERYFDGSTPARHLESWFADEVGAPTAPLRDLSAGRWRASFYPDAAQYPPSARREERRKYLVESARGAWLMKFSGLGGAARAMAARARQLSEAGFTPALVGVRHGFALSTFHADALPLSRASVPRADVVAALARYLSFVAAQFPADASRGAAPEALLAMARHNASELFGEERAAALARYTEELPGLRAQHRPTESDNKLDRWEWLVTPEGRLLKCDAEEHHAGHDCIGCQDPAWDLAGAMIEFELDAAEVDLVRAALWDHARHRVDPPKLRFYATAYAAFRAGRAQMSADGLRGWADEDAARLDAQRDRYARELAGRLP